MGIFNARQLFLKCSFLVIFKYKQMNNFLEFWESILGLETGKSNDSPNMLF